MIVFLNVSHRATVLRIPMGKWGNTTSAVNVKYNEFYITKKYKDYGDYNLKYENGTNTQSALLGASEASQSSNSQHRRLGVSAVGVLQIMIHIFLH